MLTLSQLPASFNVPNLSPYCLKVETWLNRMAREFPQLVAYCERVHSQFWT